MRLKKSLLFLPRLLPGSMLCCSYGQMGPQFSAKAQFVFQLLLVRNLVFFLIAAISSGFASPSCRLPVGAVHRAMEHRQFITASGTSRWVCWRRSVRSSFAGERVDCLVYRLHLPDRALGFFDYYWPIRRSATPTGCRRKPASFLCPNFAAISSIVICSAIRHPRKAKLQASLEEPIACMLEEQARPRLLSTPPARSPSA
jgi:hypothetical protein